MTLDLGRGAKCQMMEGRKWVSYQVRGAELIKPRAWKAKDQSRRRTQERKKLTSETGIGEEEGSIPGGPVEFRPSETPFKEVRTLVAGFKGLLLELRAWEVGSLDTEAPG